MTGLKVAIIGAGPSGLYAASELLQRAPGVQVDMFDRLPTPGGLARSGVAPDHFQRRKVVEFYERQLVSSGQFRFFGNVEVGRKLPLATLREHYGAVLFASGASTDKSLNIPGEPLSGSVAATDFVAWYNGHPDYHNYHFNLSGQRAVVIGNGNVALDVARILLLDAKTLARSDISDTALAALQQSTLTEVVIVGRRGPAQATFTLPELLELQHLDMNIRIEGDIPEAPQGRPEQQLKLRCFQALNNQRPGATRTLIFKFLHSPLEILGQQRVEGVRLGSNVLSDDGAQAIATGQQSELAADLVVRAVGYAAQPVPGLPFDSSSHTIPHNSGRVEPGVYVAGWLKRGPKGVIGSNKICSRETVTSLLSDWQGGLLSGPNSESDIAAWLEQGKHTVIDTRAWRNIDQQERENGRHQSRPRIKFANWDDLLAAAQQ